MREGRERGEKEGRSGEWEGRYTGEGERERERGDEIGERGEGKMEVVERCKGREQEETEVQKERERYACVCGGA